MRYKSKGILVFTVLFSIFLAGALYGEIDPAGAPVHKVGGDWIMRDWLIIGPFQNIVIKDNKNRDVNIAFRKDFLKTFGGEGKAVLKPISKIRFKGENGKLNAIKAQLVRSGHRGILDIGKLFGVESACAYAFCYIYAEEDMPFMFYFGSGDCAKVWVNGTQAHRVVAGRGSFPHTDNFIVHLKKGYNPVLVKIFNFSSGWDLIVEGNRIDSVANLRVDAEGVPIHSYGNGNFVRNWLVIGGFENEEVKDRLPDGSKFKGFGTDYLTSLGGEAKAKLTSETSISFDDRMERARVYLPPAAKTSLAFARLDGQVNLLRYFDDPEFNCGYAFCYIESDKAQTVRCYLGANDLAKVCVNGDLVAKKLNPGRSIVRDKAFEINLTEGLNPVLIKVCNHTDQWGFVLEVLLSDGE
jgi:hypothetical protein